MAKRLIRYIFFQNEKNLMDLGRNREPVTRIITGMNEKQIVEIMLEKITSLYGYDSIVSNGREDIRHSGTAFLHTVMAVQAQVQDQGRIIENILLVPSLSINR